MAKEKFPHFRRYHPGKHPAMIVGEQKTKSTDEYKYRKVMHKEKDGRHVNEKITPNPNPKDNNPMYVGKRVRHDDKNKFSSWKYKWDIPKKDKKK